MYSDENSASVATMRFVSLVLFLGLVALVNGNFRDVVVVSNLSSNPSPSQSIQFKKTINKPHFLGGLIGSGQVELKDILQSQNVAKGEIAYLKVKSSFSATDLLASVLTLGLYTPNTIDLEGAIVPKQVATEQEQPVQSNNLVVGGVKQEN